jgi:hypothetical protein
LTINALLSNYKDSSMALGMVKVLGLKKTVTNVSVNGKSYLNFVYNIPDDVCTRSSSLINWMNMIYFLII